MLTRYRIKGTIEEIEMESLFLIDPACPKIVVGRLVSDGSMQRVYDVQLEPVFTTIVVENQEPPLCP